MKIKIADTDPLMEIRIERSRFDGIGIFQGDDHVYVTMDMIKLFIAAVKTVAYEVLGEEVDE